MKTTVGSSDFTTENRVFKYQRNVHG